MARMRKGTITDERFINFSRQETLDYFRWIDSFTPARFNVVFPYEWNKMLVGFGKGDESLVLSKKKEKEDIYSYAE